MAQSVTFGQSQPKSGASQFLIDAANAVNSEQYDKAIDILKQGIEQDSFAAYSNIGNIYLLRGENEKAVEWLEKARECGLESMDVLDNIGRALAGLDRKDEAVEILSKAIKLQKNMKNIRLLVESMQRMGESDKAVDALEGVLEVNPQHLEIMFELGMLFERTNRLDKAEQWYKKIVEIKLLPGVYDRLGVICVKMWRLPKAVYYLRKAMQMLPDSANIRGHLGKALIHSGNMQEGMDLLREAVDKMPENPAIHSNFLFALHYFPELDPQMIFEEHKRWGLRHAPISMAKLSHDNTAEPERRLRIGYISPDFRKHPVSHYIEPLLDEHDREAVKVYGYGNIRRPDSTTHRLQSKFDCYRDIYGLSDEAVVHIIEQDKIDILVELAGHTDYNRLLVLARKPAPIQVTYLGYYDTTGIQAIDYLLTDSQLTPPESQKFYIEQLFPLPGGVCSYKPPEKAPAVTPLPAAEKGYITFGAFTTNHRINPRLLEVWSEILKLTLNSRLLLGFNSGDNEKVRDHYLSQFEKQGVSREIVKISGRKPYDEYLKQYGDVDIMLDTFPENGGTITCDALWMGVSVITLAGQHQVGRVGLSTLSHLGLEFFAASTPSEYVTKAVALASKPESLMKIRASMRSRVAGSSLCDVKQFTRDMEAAYRQMWHRWCRAQAVQVPIE